MSSLCILLFRRTYFSLWVFIKKLQTLPLHLIQISYFHFHKILTNFETNFLIKQQLFTIYRPYIYSNLYSNTYHYIFNILLRLNKKQSMHDSADQLIRGQQQMMRRFGIFQVKYEKNKCNLSQALRLIQEKQYDENVNLFGQVPFYYKILTKFAFYGSRENIMYREGQLLYVYGNMKRLFYTFHHVPNKFNTHKKAWVDQLLPQVPFYIIPKQQYKMKLWNTLIQLIFQECFDPAISNFQQVEQFIYQTIQKGHLHALLVINSIFGSEKVKDSIFQPGKFNEAKKFCFVAINIVIQFLSKLQKKDKIIQIYHCFRCIESLWRFLPLQHQTYYLLEKESYENWINSVKMFIRTQIQHDIKLPYLQQFKMYQSMAKLTIIRSLVYFLKEISFQIIKNNQKLFSTSIPMVLSLGPQLVQQLQQQSPPEIKVEVLKFILAIIDKQFIYNMDFSEQMFIFRILADYAIDPRLQKLQFILCKARIDLKNQSGHYFQEDLRFMATTAARQMFLIVRNKLTELYIFDFPSQGFVSSILYLFQHYRSEPEMFLYAFSTLDFSKFKLQATYQCKEIYDQISPYINGKSLLNTNAALIVLHKMISTSSFFQRKPQMQRITQDCKKCLKESQNIYVKINAGIIIFKLCEKKKYTQYFRSILVGAQQILYLCQKVPSYEVAERVNDLLNSRPYRITMLKVSDKIVQSSCRILKNIIELTKLDIKNNVEENRYKDTFNKFAQVIVSVVQKVGRRLMPRKLFQMFDQFVIKMLSSNFQILSSPQAHPYLLSFKPALVHILYHQSQHQYFDKNFHKQIFKFMKAYFKWPKDSSELNQIVYLVLLLVKNERSFWEQTGLIPFLNNIIQIAQKPQAIHQEILLNVFRGFLVSQVISMKIDHIAYDQLTNRILGVHIVDRIVQKNYDPNTAVSFGFVVCCAIMYYPQQLIECFKDRSISKTNVFIYFKDIFQMFSNSIDTRKKALPHKIVDQYIRAALKIYKWGKQQILKIPNRIPKELFSNYLQIFVFMVYRSYLLQSDMAMNPASSEMIDESQQVNEMIMILEKEKEGSSQQQIGVEAPQNQLDFLTLYNADGLPGRQFSKNTFQMCLNWMMTMQGSQMVMSLFNQHSLASFQQLFSVLSKRFNTQAFESDQNILQFSLPS